MKSDVKRAIKNAYALRVFEVRMVIPCVKNGLHCWYFSKTRYLPKALSHALFTALVGIFLGYGKRYQQKMLLAFDAP